MVWPWTYCNICNPKMFVLQCPTRGDPEVWNMMTEYGFTLQHVRNCYWGHWGKTIPKNCWHSCKKTHQVCNLHGKTTIWTGFVEFLSGLVGFKESSQFWNWWSLNELVSQQTQICHTLPCIDTTTRKTKLYSSWNKLVWNILCSSSSKFIRGSSLPLNVCLECQTLL